MSRDPKQIHVLVTMRLAEVKARDKLIPLLGSHLVTKVTLVRYARINLEEERLFQVNYEIGAERGWSFLSALRNVWGCFWTMLDVARNANPDIIVAFHLVPHGAVAWLVAKLTGKRVIVSMLGTDLDRDLQIPLFNSILLFVLHRCNAITVYGYKAKQELIKQGIRSEKIFLLNNTTNTDVFYPDFNTQIDKDLIFVGYLRPEKRVDLLLHALKKIHETRPQTNLLIVGDGPECTRLMALARSLGVIDSVEFYGHTNGVVEQLRRARVFVLTSEREGLPMALVEAMCTGLPTVATNVGAIESVVVDGENGYLLPPMPSPDLIAERILALLDNPDHYEKLSTMAIKVRETNSYEHATKIWDAILSSLS